MNDSHDQEINRIREAYRNRDSQGLSAQYNYGNPAFVFHMQELEWTILRMLRQDRFLLDGAKILEVGCGTGHILNRFLEFGVKEASGIELMENRVEIARKSYPRIKVICGNAAQLPYENNSFDLVMQFTCLSSISNEGLRKKIASEMWRVTRPGGRILSYDLRPRSKFLKLCIEKGKRPEVELYPISIAEFKDLFPAGQINHRSLSLFPSLASLSVWSRSLACLMSACPFLRTCFLVVIEKSANNKET